MFAVVSVGLSADISSLASSCEGLLLSYAQQQHREHRIKCLVFFSSYRAGKGVFSAMKLGKARPTKDDHRKQGGCWEKAVPS